MSDHPSLSSYLADFLPRDVKARVYHVSTPPTDTPAILAALPGQTDQSTVCESHFLGIASEDKPSGDSIFIFAIEALIFTTNTLTTIFVSKADSSGFLSELHAPTGFPSVVKTITHVFLDYLLASRLSQSRVVLSLFARSQNQYLFPGSVENAGKHVLDDRQLIKWWCKVLDDVWRPYDQATPELDKRHHVTAHVVVPGCEKSETKAFFPVSSRGDLAGNPKWHNSYPMHFIAGDDILPLRCSIPRLPDDPKSRFLDDLDGDYIGPEGQWRNVKSSSQFWEVMSYRQECHAGRLVGFIWITFSNDCSDLEHARKSHVAIELPSILNGSVAATLPTPAQSFSAATQQVSHTVPTEADQSDQADQEPNNAPESPPPSSPALPEDVDVILSGTGGTHTDRVVDKTQQEATISTVTNEQSRCDDAPNMQDFVYPTKGDIVLHSEAYEGLMDFLLQLDFAGMKTAMQSTNCWIQKVIGLAGVTAFGKSVVGRKVLAESAAKAEHIAGPQVNMLTGIRKKRKVESETLFIQAPIDGPSGNTLSSSLIRKKPKIGKEI